MRSWIIVLVLMVALGIVAIMRENQNSREIASLRRDLEELRETMANANTSTTDHVRSVSRARRSGPVANAPEAEQAEVPVAEHSDPTSQLGSSSDRSIPAGQQLAALETKVQTLQKVFKQVERGLSVPEYNPTEPERSPANPALVESPVKKRNWGEEQIVGAPDTVTAGDLPTAWASHLPDGGPEWLMAGFDQPVDLAEVRIRESHNPGAITKVTAVVDGQEVTLWEGEASASQGLRDFTVPVTGNVKANSIVVHLDTAKVPGWNEIDAVEIVGRDGSRQWATSGTASSTYAAPQLSRANQ